MNDENVSARKTRSGRGGLRSRPALASKPVEESNEAPAAKPPSKPAAAPPVLRSWEKAADFFILDLEEPTLRCAGERGVGRWGFGEGRAEAQPRAYEVTKVPLGSPG